MWLQTFLKRLRPASRRHARKPWKRITPCRLTLEALEGRDVPSYVVTDLGLLPGCVSGYAEAVNASGEVVGYDLDGNGGTHAFLWDHGSLTDLGTLGGPGSIAYGINDAGQVVGMAGTTDLTQYGTPATRAFLWQNGVMTDLGALPGSDESVAYDINNNGQVVGASEFYGPERAFLWQAGTMTDLDLYGTSSAAAINDAGQVVGTCNDYAFVWQNGTSIALDEYDVYNQGSFSSSAATAVNNFGQVAGRCVRPYVPGEEPNSVPPGALIWQNGAANQIRSWNYWGFGAFDSFATGVNDAGQVIGQAGTDSGMHAFLWQSGVVTDLTTQIPSADGTLQAQAINNAGQIVGTANGRAVLLTPQSELVISNVSVTEGNSGTTNAAFNVSLSAPSATPVMVHYATADVTAVAGSDYQATSGTLTFAPGETSKTISVLVIGDRLGEPNETFVVNLSGPTNATISGGQGVGTILDDEPRIRISDVIKAEGKKGQTTLFTFTVTLSAAYDQPVTMSYRTVDSTATTSDSDYVAKTGTLTFAPGETTKTITIEVKGDSKKEADETFYVDLFGNSSNSLFTKNRGTGTILNDD